MSAHTAKILRFLPLASVEFDRLRLTDEVRDDCGGNPLKPLNEDKWPEQVMITRRLYATVMDLAEGKPPKRRRRKKATKHWVSSHDTQ